MASSLSQEQKIKLHKLIALFLAEAIRTKRTSLSRAAEISHRVISKLSMLESESQALKMLTEIEKDFNEISVLKRALHFGYHLTDIKIYEAEIKDYVARAFTKDIHHSNSFLQDATKDGITIQELCLKYPEFCEFLEKFSEKAQILARF